MHRIIYPAAPSVVAAPGFVCHRRMVPSSDPVAYVFPSGAYLKHRTGPWCPWREGASNSWEVGGKGVQIKAGMCISRVQMCCRKGGSTTLIAPFSLRKGRKTRMNYRSNEKGSGNVDCGVQSFPRGCTPMGTFVSHLPFTGGRSCTEDPKHLRNEGAEYIF